MESKDYLNKRQPPSYRVKIDAWSVEIQGKRITVKCKHPPKEKTKRRPRGPITCFSRKARARLLKRIASVDWKSAGKGMLITVTYPDDVSDHTMDERKTHRYLLNRFIVDRCGCTLGGFWRVEWMPRLSGEYIGQLRPHIHFLYLGMWTINFRGIRERWQEIIRTDQYTQIDVSYIVVGDICSVYVAKYCAKEADASYLDNVPYRNRTGRHSGEFHRELIPMHQLQTVGRITTGILRKLQKRACDTLWWYDPRYDEGFTLLGDKAIEAIEEFLGTQIDMYGEELYTLFIK